VIYDRDEGDPDGGSCPGDRLRRSVTPGSARVRGTQARLHPHEDWRPGL